MDIPFSHKISWMKWIPLIILVLGFIAFFYFRLYEYLTFETLSSYRTFLLDWTHQHPFLAPCLFISCYIAFVATSIPNATLLTLLGGFLFGPIWGTIYVVFGATIGATIIFLAAKWALRDYFYKKIGSQIKTIENNIQHHATSYLLFLRFVPLFPFWLVNIAPALLGINTRTFFITTLFGILPGSFIYVLLGNGLGILLEQGQTPNLNIIFKPMILIPMIGLAVLSLIPIIYKKFYRKGP